MAFRAAVEGFSEMERSLTDDLVCRVISYPDEFEHSSKIRLEVFVGEQQVPEEEELDDLDALAVHVVAFLNGNAVGTGRLIDEGQGIARIGRMAVRRSYRGTGIGSAILETLLDAARSRGLQVARLAAQLHALGFYERFGFQAEGEQFMEAGILHRWMTLPLNAG